MIDENIEILYSINSQEYGVRELARSIHRRTTSVVENLHQMEEQGLITFKTQLSNTRGRAKKVPIITNLGKEYLRSYNEMQSKTLKAHQSDFKNALKNLELKKRMIERGKNPHDLFVELRETLVAIRNAK